MVRTRGCSLLVLSLALVMICGVSLRAEEADQGIYSVRKGDTLWHISRIHLQNPRLWPQIWEKNKYIKNPHLIYPGDPISLPGKGEVVGTEKAGGTAPGGAVSAEELAPSPRVREEGVISAEEVPAVPEKEAAGEEGVIPAGEETAALATKEEPSAAIGQPSRLELPAHRPAPMATLQLVADSGFIGGDEILRERRRIVKTLEPIQELSAGNLVIVNIGARDQVKPGDKFSILRPIRRVHHPHRRGSLGVLVWN
ncbi:MAG: LysM peptidoglycan-binding domain-containing protein, partial [candidate division NC10 bacterium]|nr:LysM peptidoglycan-binding domain-containing protein [candidate division NC10 bacterium]